MTRYNLKFRPGGIIPPALEVGVVLKKSIAVSASAAAEVPPESAVAPLTKGADSWYTSAENAPIQFRDYIAEAFPDTDNTADGEEYDGTFGVDDSSDYEGDISYYNGDGPSRSAWWCLQTPADKGCTVTIDMSASSPPGLPGENVDTVLYIWTTDEALPLGTLPTAETDFTTLVLVAEDDDSGVGSTSKITGQHLDANKIYWICADTYSWDTDCVYRLTMTMTVDP